MANVIKDFIRLNVKLAIAWHIERLPRTEQFTFSAVGDFNPTFTRNDLHTLWHMGRKG